MTSIRIGDAVRLPFASGKYGDVTDIVVSYVANAPIKTMLLITDIYGQQQAKWSNEVRPLHGTITQDKTDIKTAIGQMTPDQALSGHI